MPQEHPLPNSAEKHCIVNDLSSFSTDSHTLGQGFPTLSSAPIPQTFHTFVLTLNGHTWFN